MGNTRLGWTLFNLLFISLYQNLLLLSIALPALYSAQSVAPLNSLDLMASVTFLVLVLVETVADNQQEDFQNEKYRQLARGKPAEYPYSLGFVSWGLFSLSRHPNYLAVQLVLLFQGSTLLSESITGGKYPKYAQYQALVP